MREFTDSIIEDLGSRSMPTWSALVRDVQSRVTKAGLSPDIESVLSVLEGMANPQKALTDVGAQAILFGNEFSLSPRNSIANTAIEEIEDAIYRKCSQVDHKKAVEFYDRLWNQLTSEVKFRNANFGTNNILVQRVFTTNYDLGIEAFLKRKRLRFADGFEVDEVSDAVFTGRWINAETIFCKLHGSINYFGRDDGQIVRSDAILEDSDAYGREVKGRIMIYPTGEKYATRRPFYESLGQLRTALANQNERVCIVVGYSFRDAAINNAFLDGIAVNPKLRMIWITTHAEMELKNLNQLLQSRVIPLQGGFGGVSLGPLIKQIIETSIDA